LNTTGLVYGLNDRDSVPGTDSGGCFPLRHCIQLGSGSHRVSCPVCTGCFYSLVKAAGAWI